MFKHAYCVCWHTFVRGGWQSSPFYSCFLFTWEVCLHVPEQKLQIKFWIEIIIIIKLFIVLPLLSTCRSSSSSSSSSAGSARYMADFLLDFLPCHMSRTQVHSAAFYWPLLPRRWTHSLTSVLCSDELTKARGRPMLAISRASSSNTSSSSSSSSPSSSASVSW